MTLPAVRFVARKTITTIQEGSVYKERYVEATALPTDATVRQVFIDSSGAQVAEITGSVNPSYPRYVEFTAPYADVAEVPNGAGFYCYVHFSGDAAADEHMIRYGTVIRRQLSYPDSPATSIQNLPRVYEDSFQRPPGSPGGKWKFLVGQPLIVSSGLSGILEFLLSFLFSAYTAYFMRYYVPFAGDTITLRVTLLKKGDGMTVIALDCSSDGSSYLYVGFNSTDDTVELGRGIGPDITISGNLIPEITPVAHAVPSTSPGGNYKIRYDDVTKTLGLYNDDYTVEYATWTDTGNEVPHGKGYRYFAIGGTSDADNSGVQVAYIKAQDDV